MRNPCSGRSRLTTRPCRKASTISATTPKDALMIDALSIATSGLQATQSQIDTLSNNLSNMQTPGFKAKRASFGDIAVITPTQVQAGLTPSQSGAGTEVIATNAVFSQGQ